MKRVKRSTASIIEDLTSKGLTKKEIAKKIGVKYRTFLSYKRYFEASKFNENSRKAPDEVVKKIKKLASNRDIRLTQDIGDSDDVLVYIKTNYEVKKDDFKELRNITIPVSLEEWREERNKEEYVYEYIQDRYSRNSSAFDEIIIQDYQLFLENEL